ncbi:diacylglycerol/lipid kinase family protein [Nocardioides daejeonensis]|uniref:diacylglycerol/lipid kinase family protein n=1 Tax=Nocardioides daejeonensis TaxID=1046556 RepID=UPI000D74305A|nr:diacylglycerol kinase family protein [Nocardioides daejeonensis]
MTRAFTFLVNPTSGGGAAPRAVVPVARALRDAGARVEVTYSPGPKATVALVAEAVERGDVVVSVGGDGMLSSIAGQVAATGGTLGVVPAGRGNDFARMLGLPDAPDEIARILLEAEPRRIDLVEVDLPDGSSRVVAGSVYAGVDAHASEIVDRIRWMPRKLQYPVAAVRALAAFRPVAGTVTVDGETHRVRAATVVTANSAFYGSGMKIAPPAVLDDGELDIVVIAAAGKLDLIRSLPKVYDGSHVALDEVTVLRGREITLAMERPVAVGGDGEPLGVLRPGEPWTIRVLPAALSLLS